MERFECESRSTVLSVALDSVSVLTQVFISFILLVIVWTQVSTQTSQTMTQRVAQQMRSTAVTSTAGTATGQLFPTTITSEQISLNYMKRLTAVAISNILYLRNVFNEDCYGHRKLDQLKLRILSEKCNIDGAKQIVHWIKACFDAMEKKYLKQLTLGIFTDPSKPEDLIEAYSLRFSYNTDDNQVNCDLSLSNNKNESRVCNQTLTDQNLKQSTVQLLRSLIVMVQSLDTLPDDCYLTMKLLYYDDITPADYEPPGFGPTDSHSFTFKGKSISVSAGQVVTPYHTLKVKIRTNQEQFQDFANDLESESSQNQSRMISQELVDESPPPPVAINDKLADTVGQSSTAGNKRDKNDDKLAPNLLKESNKSVNREKNVADWLQAVSSTSKGGTKSQNQKSNERKVISKIKDLSVKDDNNSKHSKADTFKRKLDFEVTQDTMFNSKTNNDKRLKASLAFVKPCISNEPIKH